MRRSKAMLNRVKKALLVSAFLLSGGSALAGAADCSAPAGLVPVGVSTVLDGDTLQLDDGRRLRLIGVNTTELGRDGLADQPLAQAARRATEVFVRRGGLQLALGRSRRDHYGRYLGHLFDGRGESLEAFLVRQGLGLVVAIPPNLELLDCLQEAEQEARRRRLGLWREAGWPIDLGRAPQLTPGFQLLRGVVHSVTPGRRSWFVELEGLVVLRIDKQDLDRFSDRDFSTWVGRPLEVRGWLVRRNLSPEQRKKGFLPWLMPVRHPAALGP